MHRSIYILFLVLFFFSAAQAQDKKYVYKDTSLIKDQEQVEAPATGKVIEKIREAVTKAGQNYEEEKPDTSLYVNELNLAADSIQRWKDLKEFAYAKYLDSLLKERQKKQANASSPRMQKPGILDRFFSSSAVRVFLWTLAVAFIIFVLYRLFLAEGVFRRETKTARQSTPQAEEEVITGESDFDALISQALQAGNYRQAVRYQYLKTLHKLADKKIIELAKDKTNFQYVHEISNPAFQHAFASLTLNYEYVWYGEFAIDKDIYQKIETGFKGLNQKI